MSDPEEVLMLSVTSVIILNKMYRLLAKSLFLLEKQRE